MANVLRRKEAVGAEKAAEAPKKRVAKPKKAVADDPLPELLPDVKGETFDERVAKECQRIFREWGANDPSFWFRDFWLAARVSVPGVLDIMTEEKDRIDIVLGSAVSQGLIVTKGPGVFIDRAYVWSERARTLWKTVPAPELPKEAWRLKAEADDAHAAARIAVIRVVTAIYRADHDNSRSFDSGWLWDRFKMNRGIDYPVSVNTSHVLFEHALAAGLVLGDAHTAAWNHKAFAKNEAPQEKETTMKTESEDMSTRKERVRAFLKDLWHGHVPYLKGPLNGTSIAAAYFLWAGTSLEPKPQNHQEIQDNAWQDLSLFYGTAGVDLWSWNTTRATELFGPRAASVVVVETKELAVAHPAPNTGMTDKEQATWFASWLIANTSPAEQTEGWNQHDLFGRYSLWTGQAKTPLLSWAGLEKAMLESALVFRSAKGQWFVSDKANAALAKAPPKAQAFGENWALWNVRRGPAGMWDVFPSEADAKGAEAFYPDLYDGRAPVRVGELGKGQVGEHVRQEAIAFSLANQALSEQKTKLSTENKRLDTEARASRAAYQELLVTHDEALLLIAKEKPKAASVWEKKEDRYAAGLLDAYEAIEAILTREDDPT